MPRTAPVAVVLAVAVAACVVDQAAPLDSAPRPDAAVDAPPPPPPPVCPLTGRYTLLSIWCWSGSAQHVLSGFVTSASDSWLDFEEVGGVCQVRLGFAGASCMEVQSFTARRVPDDPGGRWALDSAGIDRCAPAGCGFGLEDDACVVGARAGTVMADVGLVLDVGDLDLGLEGFAGGCAQAGYLHEVQTWRPAWDPGV